MRRFAGSFVVLFLATALPACSPELPSIRLGGTEYHGVSDGCGCDASACRCVHCRSRQEPKPACSCSHPE